MQFADKIHALSIKTTRRNDSDVNHVTGPNFQSDICLFKENFLVFCGEIICESFLKNFGSLCVLESCDDTLTRFIAYVLNPRNGSCVCVFLFQHVF